ncbi:MAG: Rieske 2Fe-2S domain-containing protein [Aquisalimonadaceae bacterium]
MSWIEVADISTLDDKSVTRVNAGEFDVLVVKGEESCAVIPPSCPHMSAELAEGVFDGCVLTCTKHLWQWSIPDGGTPLGVAETPLLMYESKVEDGILYVNVANQLLYDHECEEQD